MGAGEYTADIKKIISGSWLPYAGLLEKAT